MADEGEATQQTGSDTWGDDIPTDRKAQLEERLQAWEAEADHGEKRGPFHGFTLTGADVYWLAARSLAGSDDESAIATTKARLTTDGWPPAVPELHLEGADLLVAHLERARLRQAHLEGANLSEANLSEANLSEANLSEANLEWAHLERAVLQVTHLERASLEGAQLEGANLGGAQLGRAYLGDAEGTGANLEWAHLEGADLYRAQLERANLTSAHLERANFEGAQLAGAVLREAQLAGARLQGAQLAGADLTRASFDKTSHLNVAVMAGVSLDQVTFDNVNLTVVDWSRVPVLGDEVTAKQAAASNGKPKHAALRRNEYLAAVRANRVLALTLRSQGMNEDADKFAYRAQVLQRQVLRRQGKYGRALGSWLLDVVSGYGYKPMRSIVAYILIICLFAGAYLLNAQFAAPHLSWDEALVLSISSFHGRGFFTSGISLGDTLARLAAGEAIIGLLIEITFIATFTQRFFAR